MSDGKQDPERMDYKIGYFNQGERARQKQQARDRDAARLKSGEISRADLAKQNDFFAAFPIHKFKIKSIGGEPFDLRKKESDKSSDSQP